jgi:hypothetical protein
MRNLYRSSPVSRSVAQETILSVCGSIDSTTEMSSEVIHTDPCPAWIDPVLRKLQQIIYGMEKLTSKYAKSSASS